MTELVTKVIELQDNTPDGVIFDADTILADLIEKCDFHISGLAKYLFKIWKESDDKFAVEEMFYLFTDTKFEDYLNSCVEIMENQKDEREI